MKLALVAVAFLATPALAQSPQIYAPNGTYLGNLNNNPCVCRSRERKGWPESLRPW